MSATTVQTHTPRATLVALPVLTLCFVLVVYTLTHEAGHAIVGMLFGQTLTALKVNFLTLSAHVGLVGELTQAQHALQSIGGVALPLVIWLIFISCVPRRSTFLVELLKCIATVAVLSTLLAWMVLPVLYRLGQAPSDDVSYFLGYSGWEPLVLSFGALVICIGGWLWFFTKIQGIRSELALFSMADGNVVHTGLRLPLALMTGILIACSSLIVVLSNALNPLAPPQGFQPIAQLDLASCARTTETLWQFALDQPAEIGIYAVVQGINTTYFDLRLIGSDGVDAVILHGEDYTADQDLVTWSRVLPPGQYRLVATAHQTPGTISIYGKRQVKRNEETFMTITQRPYQSGATLYEIGRLIRRAYAAQPNWNTYSFARFDIWMQRRLADEVLFNKLDWPQDFQLWESDSNLIGAVFFESPSDAALIGDPAHPELIEPMLDWAEAHYRSKNGNQPLMIEAMESNVTRCDLLKSHGYTLFPGYFIHRHKPLDPAEVEEVNLPPGFSIKSIETDEDRRLYPIAVQSVFSRSATVEQDKFLEQAPSYVPELNLLAWSDQHEIAAFCTVWIDPVNHYAEFEPVGTVPSFQKRGLGSALLAYGHNRLREKGCPLATVQSWSASEGANMLYQAAGLLPKDQQLNWVKA